MLVEAIYTVKALVFENGGELTMPYTQQVILKGIIDQLFSISGLKK